MILWIIYTSFNYYSHPHKLKKGKNCKVGGENHEVKLENCIYCGCCRIYMVLYLIKLFILYIIIRLISNVNVQVRKEKLGDRITALHQLVSPFGKVINRGLIIKL